MNLWLRFIIVLLRALRRARLHPLDESVIELRVWPGDLDINGHMNNGRYLTVMDLGRTDLIARNGLGRVALSRKWRPLVGSAMIRFRRPLKPFQRYRLCSRIVCWDDKWFYLQQRFTCADTLIAVALVKGLLRGRDGNIPTARVITVLGLTESSPAMPPVITLWQQSESLLQDG